MPDDLGSFQPEGTEETNDPHTFDLADLFNLHSEQDRDSWLRSQTARDALDTAEREELVRRYVDRHRR